MSDEPLPNSEIILYQTEDGRTRIQVRLQDEAVCLTQQMAELFQRERSVITKHIRNIFVEGELVEEAVCANFARTAADGKTYQTAAYNLDVIKPWRSRSTENRSLPSPIIGGGVPHRCAAGGPGFSCKEILNNCLRPEELSDPL